MNEQMNKNSVVYTCPYCSFRSPTARGAMVHTRMKHQNLTKMKLSDFIPTPIMKQPEELNLTSGNTIDNDYPDFLFDTKDEKEIFLHLRRLQDNNGELCSKTALYLYRNDKYVNTLKKIADKSTPLYLSYVGDALGEIIPTVDIKSSLTKDVSNLKEKVAKLQENYNTLVQEIEIKQQQADELQTIEREVETRKSELAQLSDRFDSKKIDKVIVAMDEILTSKFMHNQMENYYLLTADNFKTFTYLFDRLVVLYGKKTH